MDGWNTSFLLEKPIFRGKLLVSGSVTTIGGSQFSVDHDSGRKGNLIRATKKNLLSCTSHYTSCLMRNFIMVFVDNPPHSWVVQATKNALKRIDGSNPILRIGI